jgi:glycosyltransferase involved in cell wall biosynthesis
MVTRSGNADETAEPCITGEVPDRKMKPPKVSVLVPVFNSERFLAECLDSILAQDFSDYELLVADDGSTDGSIAIIEQYAVRDSRIHWWRNPVNLGPAANLNLCLRAARGEYIKFVFSDDKLLVPSALRRMFEALENDSTITLVGSAAYVINADSRLVQVRDFSPGEGRQPGRELILQCLSGPVNLIGEPSVMMFRRRQAARGFDERFRQLLDLELWFHLLELGDFAGIAEPLGAWRSHPAQETVKNIRNGNSARDDVLLKTIYFSKEWVRQSAPRRMLFDQIRRLQKCSGQAETVLAAELMRTLGRGRWFYYWLRRRAERLSQSFEFWQRDGRTADGGSLAKKTPPVLEKTGCSDHPVVSVLVPVFNGEQFLAECLDSILAQDFFDYELLIADDGSTDGSIEIIERYAARDPRIRWWRNPANLGLTGNFNCCLRAARGEYIKYVLQDDLLLSPSALRQMVAALDAAPAVSLAASASHIIDEQSHMLESRRQFGPSAVWNGHEVILQCLEHATNLIGEPSLAMFRRQHAARGFDARYAQLVDMEMWFHLLEQGRFAYLDEPLCAFRKHARQQTAVNRLTGIGQNETTMLLENYFSKPWLRAKVSRRMLFRQIYYLRKNRVERGRLLIANMMALLKSGWYALYWIEHKLFRPFRNLKKWLRKLSGDSVIKIRRRESRNREADSYLDRSHHE